jgi:hypothetical protein
MARHFRVCLALGCLLSLLVPARAPAAVFDEFEVHGTDIAHPGTPTTDLFLNYGVRGFRSPGFHGGLATDRALYLSPLLGMGVTRWWEAAVVLPMAVDRQGSHRAGGAKAHNVFVLPHAAEAAWTFGAVVELTALTRRFQPMTFGWEVRPLAQFRQGPWTLHLTLGFTGGLGRHGEAVLAPAASLYWAATERLALGLEHYAELGTLAGPEPLARQAHQLFVVTQAVLGPLMVNLGLGRGLTSATDRWVAKAHLAYQF